MLTSMYKTSLQEEKSSGPGFTTRMLLTGMKSKEPTDKLPILKPFSHFTLGCTAEDESGKMDIALQDLCDFLGKEATFTPHSVVNLGTTEKPLYGIKLDLGENSRELAEKFSKLFDSTMCAELNGKLYKWKGEPGSEKRMPHVTIGPKEEDQKKAEILVESKPELVFGRVDYKKIGPHDPCIQYLLGSEKTESKKKLAI